MDWIKNIGPVEVSAIIGAAYSIVRIIVVATPTKKDDKAVRKLGTILKILAKIVGLDYTQGRKKYKL